MFVQLTHYFEKTKMAIDTTLIEYIVEYGEGSKIRSAKPDGSFFKDFYVAEDLNTVCEIINKTYKSKETSIAIYYKKSLFK